MKYYLTSEYKKLNKDQWSNFILTHSRGNIFHSPEIVELYEISVKHEPIVIACIDESNTIVGILVADVQREHKGYIGELSARAIVWGGPIVINNESQIASLILEEFSRICKTKVVYSQFRNLWNTEMYHDLFLKQKYKFEEHLDILFDLQQDSSVLWAEVHPTRRKQINRGLKREIQTRIIDVLSPEDFIACYSILEQVYKEAKLPFPNKEYFLNAITLLGRRNEFKVVLAKYKEKIVGFRFFLCFNGLIYDWYAGSLKEHYDKYPNDILPWQIINWGSKNGFKTFDFGGAGKPGITYGVRDYKLKFGGRLVNFGRYEKIHKPLLMIFSRVGYFFWQKLKC